MTQLSDIVLSDPEILGGTPVFAIAALDVARATLLAGARPS
jgi:hypothetical protein